MAQLRISGMAKKNIAKQMVFVTLSSRNISAPLLSWWWPLSVLPSFAPDALGATAATATSRLPRRSGSAWLCGWKKSISEQWRRRRMSKLKCRNLRAKIQKYQKWFCSKNVFRPRKQIGFQLQKWMIEGPMAFPTSGQIHVHLFHKRMLQTFPRLCQRFTDWVWLCKNVV